MSIKIPVRRWIPTVPSRGGPTGRHARFLAHAIQLEEAGPPRLIGAMTFFLFALIVGFIAWAAIAKVDEAAVTQGQVQPSGSLRLVQHLEGGIVTAINVGEGDLVKPGEILIRLDPTADRAELGRLRARHTLLRLQAERLRAFATGEVADFADPAGAHGDLVDDQRAILALQTRAHETQRDVLRRQIAERQAEFDILAAQRRTMTRQVELIEEERRLREVLLKKGLVSRIVYLEIQRELNRAQGDLAEVTGQQARVRQSIGGARGRLTELDARLENEALTEMGRVTGELAELRETIALLEDRVRRLDVKAPVAGVVKRLNVHTIGGVVGAGEPIMEIVPLDDELVIETRIAPRDIGHVAPGQAVSVKISTYDFARFGDLPGRLERISASTFQDEQGHHYYKGIIRLARNYVGNDPAQNPVLPGMTVQANIRTGERTVLQYLLKPLYRAMNSAFRER